MYGHRITRYRRSTALDHLERFCQTEGVFDVTRLSKTLENCERELIQVRRKPMEKLWRGFATTRLQGDRYKMRVVDLYPRNLAAKRKFSPVIHPVRALNLRCPP